MHAQDQDRDPREFTLDVLEQIDAAVKPEWAPEDDDYRARARALVLTIK